MATGHAEHELPTFGGLSVGARVIEPDVYTRFQGLFTRPTHGLKIVSRAGGRVFGVSTWSEQHRTGIAPYGIETLRIATVGFRAGRIVIERHVQQWQLGPLRERLLPTFPVEPCVRFIVDTETVARLDGPDISKPRGLPEACDLEDLAIVSPSDGEILQDLETAEKQVLSSGLYDDIFDARNVRAVHDVRHTMASHTMLAPFMAQAVGYFVGRSA
jgi:hypothetical protein